MQYKYLLFDADNTLFDFGMAEFHAFRETCDHAGIRWSQEGYDAYSRINDALWKKLERGETTQAELKIRRFREFLQWCGFAGDKEEKAVFMGEKYKELLGKQTFLMPHAEEVLAVLAEKGYELSVVTNGISAIQRARMAASPIRRYIRSMYISEELTVAKPDPLYFEKVLKDMGSPEPEKVLVIGDSLSSDIDGAAAAGLDSVWFTPGQTDAKGRTPTYTIHELTELLRIL